MQDVAGIPQENVRLGDLPMDERRKLILERGKLFHARRAQRMRQLFASILGGYYTIERE